MRHSKWLVRLAFLGVLALVAAACAAEEEEVAPPAAEEETAPPAETAADICAADEFGCAEYGPDEPIRVGTLLAISGDVAFLGQDSQNGAALAIDNLDGALDGNNGQLLGHDVELVNEDDGCSAEGGQAGATKLAADPTLVAVIGTSCSSAALGVADQILSDVGILTISPSNTNPNLTAEGTHQPFYMRTAHNDLIQGAVVANFLVDQGFETLATINDESPYADALAAVARTNFEAQGGTITGVEQIQSTDTDFKPLLTSLGEGSPDAIFGPNFNPACALTVQQMKGITGLEDTVYVGADGCLDPTYLEIAGDAADGSFVSGPDLSAFQQADFYQNTFLPAYEEAFGSAPTAAFHAHAWDAMQILFQAIQQVAIEEDGSLFIPRTALRDAALATQGLEGITGTLGCNELGDCAAAVTIAVYQAPFLPIEGGEEPADPVFSQSLSLEEAQGAA